MYLVFGQGISSIEVSKQELFIAMFLYFYKKNYSEEITSRSDSFLENERIQFQVIIGSFIENERNQFQVIIDSFLEDERIQFQVIICSFIKNERMQFQVIIDASASLSKECFLEPAEGQEKTIRVSSCDHHLFFYFSHSPPHARSKVFLYLYR